MNKIVKWTLISIGIGFVLHHLLLIFEYFLILFIFSDFSACDEKSVRDKKFIFYESEDPLHKQRILNSSKILYKYANHGKFAWSDSHFGEFILDSIENINQAKFIKDLLPFYYTKFILDSNVIEAIELLYSNESFGEGIYEKTANDITYKVKRYYTKQGSGTRFFYIYHNISTRP